MASTLASSFWPFVQKTENCWFWVGHIHGGYGRVSVKGVRIMAHRVALKLCGINIPSGLVTDHLCRNKNCVNPEHLEVVESKVNILRGYGAPAVNARKTHCLRGHELNRENIYESGNGRQCKRCRRLTASNRYYEKVRNSTAKGDHS